MRRMLVSLIFLPLLSALFHSHPLTACGRATPMFTSSHTFQWISLSLVRNAVPNAAQLNVCQRKDQGQNNLLAWNCRWRFLVSKVIAKQDHKTDFLLVALGHRTRHTQSGKNPSFMRQIKVRIELISLLCLKEKISRCDFNSKIVGPFTSGIKFAAFFLHLLWISGAQREKGKVTQVWMTGMVGGHDPESRV